MPLFVIYLVVYQAYMNSQNYDITQYCDFWVYLVYALLAICKKAMVYFRTRRASVWLLKTAD